MAQGRFIGDLTAHVLRIAGLRPGMRVLDIGCGAGDVSFLAASLVGEDGAVIGVDKSAEAVGLASQRAAAAQLNNVRFLAADVTDVTFDQPVDALIGRLVLMYFPDPSAILRRLAGFVRPGGVIAFQEIDALAVACEPLCDTFRITDYRITETLRRAGAHLRTGLHLPAIFRRVGLPEPQTLQMARVEHGPDAEGYAWMAELTRSLLPVMEKTGVATAEDVQVDTLAARLRDEALEKDATLVLPPLVGAWTTVRG